MGLDWSLSFFIVWFNFFHHFSSQPTLSALKSFIVFFYYPASTYSCSPPSAWNRGNYCRNKNLCHAKFTSFWQHFASKSREPMRKQQVPVCLRRNPPNTRFFRYLPDMVADGIDALSINRFEKAMAPPCSTSLEDICRCNWQNAPRHCVSAHLMAF